MSFSGNCKCKFDCNKLPPANMKIKLFKLFYAMEYVEQRNYLMSLLQLLPVKRRRHGMYDDEEQSRRQCSIAFSVPDGDGNMIRVCKQTFMEIFAITTQCIKTLVAKKKNGALTFEDNRGGKRRGTAKYDVTERKLVQEHVNSFPRDVSHYCQNQSAKEKEYLSPDLNICKLYRAFTLKYPNVQVSRKYYYKVFKKDFPNLSFKLPRIDTCKTCDLLALKAKLNTEEGRQAKTQLDLHH